jgi:hypothetical protein
VVLLEVGLKTLSRRKTDRGAVSKIIISVLRKMKKVQFSQTTSESALPKLSYNNFSSYLAQKGMRVLDRRKPNPYADELEIPADTHVTLMKQPDLDFLKKEKHVVVPKYTLHVDDHGIHWKVDGSGRTRTLRVFDKVTEDAYWGMDAERKARFLRDYIDNVDQWIIGIEISVSESWVERQRIRDEFNVKARKWYEYLQSFRLTIETVFDKRQYKMYRELYDRLDHEFEIQETILEKATEMSYWKALREFWREIKKAFSS